MPHIRMRAVSNECVQKLSATLPQELAEVMNTSPDNFTFECIPTTFYAEGKPTASYPFVEVLWFARSQEIQDASAKVITNQVKAVSSAADVVVVFLPLNQTSYYENEVHF